MDNLAIYELEGENTYRPTRCAGSPWSKSMQHGGPVLGLFAREVENAATETGLRVARLTVDLFKAVPMQTLVAETRFVRQGKRIAAIESTLRPLDSDVPVSRASGLLLRAEPHDKPSWETPECPPPSPASTEATTRDAASKRGNLPPGFHEFIESRTGVDDAGPYVWMTTKLDLVAGEAISPFQRAAAMTDMTLGTQMRIAARRRATASAGDESPAMGALMINADTTSYWERPFTGEWLGMRPRLITERDGIGTAETVLYDAEGRVGTSTQSALVQHQFRMP